MLGKGLWADRKWKIMTETESLITKLSREKQNERERGLIV